MRPHDAAYKLLFSFPEMVRDLLAGFVCDAWVAERHGVAHRRRSPTLESPDADTTRALGRLASERRCRIIERTIRNG